MTYAPGYVEQVPPMVSPFTLNWGFMTEGDAGASPASATWESGNRAVFVPIFVPTVCIAKRVWWANGATATGSATIEVGIYANAGYKPVTKLVSGSATQATASVLQFVDVTDTILTPGLWWLAITASTTTNTTLFRSQVASTSVDELYRMEQATANPLPSPATPVKSSAQNIWLCGFSTTTIT